MGYFSILDLEEPEEGLRTVPSFFADLNLDQLIDRIAGEWGSDVGGYYYRLPESKACEDYRRDIYQDVKKQEVFDGIELFWQKMQKREDIKRQKEEVEEAIQKQVWHIREVGLYCEALGGLSECLEKADISSEGLRSLRARLKEYLSDEAFMKMRQQAETLAARLKSFRVFLTYEGDRLSVAVGSGVAEYERFLDACFPQKEAYLKNPFLASPDLAKLELEVVKIFKEKQKGFFRETAEFYKGYACYERADILRLQREVRYYAAFRHFQKKWEEKGFEFAVPSVDVQAELGAHGLYDLALACVCAEEDRRVISNDAEYRAGEKFFVLTGPNQGGKTTYARSLGQLVYFTKMGLDVPACEANVPYYSHILTHFSVEESAESGRGKLVDELDRLLPMMKCRTGNAFVIINELFTTAANYDACIMGKKVLEHFIETDCRGIYVTHLTELTEAHEGVVSLRAVLDEKKVQTFKIERSKAGEETSAGVQIKKYRLTYEQIKERFS